jgi:hypothetical protein
MNMTPVIDLISRSGYAGKTITYILVIFSIISWAVILNRMIFLFLANRKNKIYRNSVTSGIISNIQSMDKKITLIASGTDRKYRSD